MYDFIEWTHILYTTKHQNVDLLLFWLIKWLTITKRESNKIAQYNSIQLKSSQVPKNIVHFHSFSIASRILFLLFEVAPNCIEYSGPMKSINKYYREFTMHSQNSIVITQFFVDDFWWCKSLKRFFDAVSMVKYVFNRNIFRLCFWLDWHHLPA